MSLPGMQRLYSHLLGKQLVPPACHAQWLLSLFALDHSAGLLAWNRAFQCVLLASAQLIDCHETVLGSVTAGVQCTELQRLLGAQD